jgi:hypothetical protein
MPLNEGLELGLTTSQDDPYLMMNHDKRKMTAAMETMEHYCNADPASPSAIPRPRLLVRGGVWIGLLGSDISEGIAGFGYTVEAALRAFDARYSLVSRSGLAASIPTLEIA